MMILTNEDVDRELKYYAALIALKNGVANVFHFQWLQDLANMLLIASQTSKSRKFMAAFVNDNLMPILNSMRKSFTAEMSDYKILGIIIERNRAFWLSQNRELFDFCANELLAFYKDRNENK